MFPVISQEQPAVSAAPLSHRDLGERSYRIGLAFVFVAAALLRFHNLGVRGFWEDEGYTWNLIRLPWRQFFEGIVTRAMDMAVYYTLMRFWVPFGNSEFWLRAFSALFSIATVPVIAELGKRLYSRKAGLFAAAFFAVHVHMIRNAQETRSYALVTFLAAMGWLQLYRTTRNPGTRNWLLFFAIGILEVYSHLISIFNVAAQLLTLCFWPHSRLEWKPLFRGLAVFSIGMIPGVWYTFRNASVMEQIPPLSPQVLLEFFNEILGRLGNRFLLAFVALAFFAVVIVFVRTWIREKSGDSTWAASVPVVGFLAPIAALIAYSMYRPLLVPRYLAIVVVPLVLGLGYLCAQMRSAGSIICALGMVGVLAWPLPSYYQGQSWQDFRGAVQYIQSRQQPGDALIAWRTMAKPNLNYYASRGPAFPEYIFPDTGKYYLPLDQEIRPNPYTLPGIVAARNRIWIVYTLDRSPLESGFVPPLYLQRIVERTHRRVSVQQFRNVLVEEYSF